MSAKTIMVAILVLISSTAISAFAWWSLVYPSAAGRVPLPVVRVLNTPPAIVGILYGRQTNGNFLSAVMRYCDFCSQREHMASYFAAALPAYMFVFGFVAFGVARFKRLTRTAT